VNITTKSRLNGVLADLSRSRSRSGEFDWAILVPDFTVMLKREIEDDSQVLDELLDDISRGIVRDFVRSNAPPVPDDTDQLALFYDADALLSLGDREVIRMANARAVHLERYRTVLTTNFQSQSNAYFGRMAYIDDRLVPLRDRGCTLAEVEAGTEQAAA
jgi:hypothetical protein